MFKKLTKATLMLAAIGVFMSGTLTKEAFAQGADKNANPLANEAHITYLKNGLKVYILPDERFPLVSTRLYVRAGSAYETPEDAGISHVLEHMVFKGSEKRPKGQISRDVEAAGGYLNASTSFDYTQYLTDLPSRHWALGLDIVKDMAFLSTLSAKELELEKEVVLAELQRSLDNPTSRIFKELQANALKGTSYERPIIGFVDTIKAVSVESMRDYIAKYYQPQNMLLVVVGNVKPDEVLAEAQKLFGDLQNTADITPVSPINMDELSNASVSVQRGPWTKVQLGFALPVPGDSDARTAPLDALAFLLGGDATSYLYKKYKYDKKLVDEIFVLNYGFERLGMFYFSIQLDADKIEAFWKEFVADMASLNADIFTDADIARAKLQMEDGYHRVKETLSGLASWKGQLELFHGGEQGEKNFITMLNDINRQQLQETIDTWIVPERFNVAILAPTDAKIPDLEPTLQKLWPAKASEANEKNVKNHGKTKVVELGQGRKLVLIPDNTMPYTAVDFLMSGGDSLVKNTEQGLASLTARVLTSGTKDLSAPELETYLAERAAGLGAFSGRQSFGLSMQAPSRFNDELFTLFNKVLTEPAFLNEEVEREIENQVADIHVRDERALSLAFSNLSKFLFDPTHTYSYKSSGDIEGVKKYNRDAVLGFWEKQITNPWVLAVAGDFDEEQVIAFAKSLPIPTAKSMDIAEPNWGKDFELELTLPERDQAHLMLAFPTVPIGHADAVGLELLQNILRGQSGMLFTELRDKQGLGYTVTAQNRHFQKAGYMFFYIGTEPEKIEQAKKGFATVIDALHAKNVSEGELLMAQNQMEGAYYRGRQSLASRSGEAVLLSTLGQDLDFKMENIEKSKKVSAEDLRNLAKKYLQMDRAYTLTVMP